MKKAKIISVIALCIALFALTAVLSVYAAGEGEPNDSKANATSISLNTEVTGNISKSSDQDWFKIKLSQAGYITVDLNHEIISSSSKYWRIYVYQSDGVTGVNDYDEHWTVAGNQAGSTPQIGLKAGTYYIKIQYNPYNFSDVTYTLRVNFTQTDYTELEPNATVKKATNIMVNADYNGSLAGSSDADWFKFQLENDGFIVVDFHHELISSSSKYWKVYVYQADGVTTVNACNECWLVSGNANESTSQIGLKAGTYYIKIQYNPYNFSSVPYQLKVRFTESAFTEQEPNSTSQLATVMDVNQDYMGAVADSGDVDWYRFTIPENGYVTVIFNHELISSSSSYWQVYLYQADGVTGTNDYDKYWLIDGNVNANTSQIGLPAGTYLVKVKYNPYNHSDVTYQLRIDYNQSEYWESEPNSTVSKATEIKPNIQYYGAISDSADEDWYRLTLSASTEVTINFTHELISSSSSFWKVTLYQADGVTELISNLVRGNENGSFNVGTLNSGTYYIKVKYNPYNHSDVTYQLNVSEKHDCKGPWVIKTDATCLTDGLQEMVCEICSKVIKQEVLPATGHTLTNEEVLKAPTCTSVGQKKGTCLACGEQVTMDIAMLAHKYTEWKIETSASCTAQGKEVRDCQECSHSEERVIEAKNHTWGEWEIISGSKLIPPIVKEKQCSACAEVEVQKDWSYVWVTVLAAVALIGALIGVINYVKAFRNG